MTAITSDWEENEIIFDIVIGTMIDVKWKRFLAELDNAEDSYFTVSSPGMTKHSFYIVCNKIL